MSGIVEEVGEDCEADVKKGDRVYGVCHCANFVSHQRPTSSLMCIEVIRTILKTALSRSLL